MTNENDKIEKLSDRELDLLKLEYQECVSSSRFHVGIRFSYFVSFTTVFLILVGTFNYIWAMEPDKLGRLKPWTMISIAGFGLFTAIVAIMIEIRNHQLYRTADIRAAFLEKKMGIIGIIGGIRQIYANPVKPHRILWVPITHTVGIRMFYGVVLLIWILLILISRYEN